MTFWLSLLFTVELALAGLALYLCVRRSGTSPALAAAIGYVLLLAGYSMLAHLLFYAGLHRHSWPFDLALLSLSALAIYRHLDTLHAERQRLQSAMRRWPRWWLIGTLSAACYVLAQAWLLPPASQDGNAYHLPRVLLFMNTGSLHPEQYNYTYQITHSTGYDLLSFWFLRFHSDFGLGLFSWLAGAMILIGTVSLVQRGYRRPALTVLIAIGTAGFTGLTVQASSVKNDLTVAALSVALLLLGRELLKGRLRYLPYALLAAVFAFSCKYYSVGFSAPLLGLIALTLLWRRRPDVMDLLRRAGRELVPLSTRPLRVTNWLALALSALLTVSIALHWSHNRAEFGAAFGDPAAVAAHRNLDGVSGAVANLTRYFFQLSAPPTLAGGAALEALLYDSGLLDRTAGVSEIYHGQPLAGGLLSLLPVEESSWFGPLGAILWLPALLAGLLFARRKSGRDGGLTRIAMLALIAWLLLLAWSLAWTPFINRYFALFFSVLPLGLAALCARVLPASFLASTARHWLMHRGARLLAATVWLWLCFVLSTQLARPAINVYEIAHAALQRLGKPELANFKIKQAGLRYPGPLLGTWSHFVVDRDAYYRVHFFADPITPFVRKLPPGARLLILAAPDSQVLPFLIRRPDTQITLGGLDQINTGQYEFTELASAPPAERAFDFILFQGIAVPEALAGQRQVFALPANLSGRTPVSLIALD